MKPSSAPPYLMDHRNLWVTQKAYFSLLTHTKQLLLLLLYDTTARIEYSFWIHGRNYEQTYERMDRQTWRLK